VSYLTSGARALCAAAVLLAASGPDFAQSKGQGPRRAGKRPSKAAKAAPAWPTFEARHADWVRRKELAAQAGGGGPDALTQYLIDEVVVTGVFETDTGYGVFLYAKPTGTTFFASAGATLYNGRLAEILSGGGFSDEIQVVFAERAARAGAERRVVKRVEAAPTPEPAAPDAA
jgi:hypothetical protein